MSHSVFAEMIALLATITADPLMKGLISSPKVKSEQLAELSVEGSGSFSSGTAALQAGAHW